MVKINKLKKENSAIKFYELKSEPSDKMFVELRSLNDFLSLSVDVFYYEKFYKSGEATLDAMLEFIHRFLEEEGFISEFEKFTDYLFGNELDDLMDIFKQQEYIAYYLYNVDKHICFKDTKKYTYRGVSENELYDIIGNMFDDYFNDEDYDNIDDEEEYDDIDDED